MEYIIVSFRSRAESIKISSMLSKFGIKNELVNTPKEANIGCGLSIKILPNSLNQVKNILSSVNLTSFAGFFACKYVSNRWFVRSI